MSLSGMISRMLKKSRIRTKIGSSSANEAFASKLKIGRLLLKVLNCIGRVSILRGNLCPRTFSSIARSEGLKHLFASYFGCVTSIGANSLFNCILRSGTRGQALTRSALFVSNEEYYELWGILGITELRWRASIGFSI